MTDRPDDLLAARLRREIGLTPVASPVIWAEVERRRAAWRPTSHHRRPQRRATLAAAVIVLFAGVGVWTMHGDGPAPRGRPLAAVDPDRQATSGPRPGISDLRSDDPFVLAVLRLLPPGTRLGEAARVQVPQVGKADYLRLSARRGGVTYEVAIHRRFEEGELSTPELVPGGKAWPGAEGDLTYLYFRSDTNVGLYLAITRDDRDGADVELLALARAIVADPFLGQITIEG